MQCDTVRYQHGAVHLATCTCARTEKQEPNSSRSEEHQKVPCSLASTHCTLRAPPNYLQYSAEGTLLRPEASGGKHASGKRTANDHKTKPTQVRAPLSTFTATTHSG